jgi:predicted nucleic acid-binding protein
MTDQAGPIEEIVRAPETDLHVPALCDVEVTAGLRRALAGRALSFQRALLAVEDYLDLPLSRHGHQALLDRILDLRMNFSAYDATYVALAEQLGAILLTADRALMRAARSHTRVATLP